MYIRIRQDVGRIIEDLTLALENYKLNSDEKDDLICELLRSKQRINLILGANGKWFLCEDGKSILEVD